MQSRKTPQADLENKRGTWRSVGFTSVLALILAALAWTSYDVNIVRASDFEVDLLEDEVIPVNVIPPPPPPPQNPPAQSHPARTMDIPVHHQLQRSRRTPSTRSTRAACISSDTERGRRWDSV